MKKIEVRAADRCQIERRPDFAETVLVPALATIRQSAGWQAIVTSAGLGIAKRAACVALKLSLNNRLIYNRPYPNDPLPIEFIKDILGKSDSLPVYTETEEGSFRCAIETQPARDIGRIGDEQLNAEDEIRNVFAILLQHLAVTG